VVRCPVHGGRSSSLSLQVRGGTLSARCWNCQAGGDLLWLVAAVERLDVRRDFAEVLRRAAELAGGAVATCKPSLQVREEVPRLPPEVAAELLGRICEAGRLGSHGAVERYLDGRGLLNAARADGWASLPSLPILLECAREAWQWIGSRQGSHKVEAESLGELPGPGRCVSALGDSSDGPTFGLQRVQGAGKPSGQVSGGFAFSSLEDLLAAARLAFWGRGGELVTLWGRHRLVIPWRGPDGRIQALQRRLVDKPRRMRDGREEPRYVLTWAPRWPYGIERLEVDDGTDCRDSDGSGTTVRYGIQIPGVRSTGLPAGVAEHDAAHSPIVHAGRCGPLPVAFVEGALDTLAARLLLKRPAIVLGLPGTGGWVSSWAGLVDGRKVFWGLDGDAAGDRKAAQGAIDVAEAQGRITEGTAREGRRRLGERLAALAGISRELKLGGIDEAEAALRREALGPARCVLCGAEAAHLCGACGRVRPRGKDWGEAWEKWLRR
jgi:hypothetical protein